MKKIILLSFLSCVFLLSVFGQNNKVGGKYVYEFRDGTTVIGTFIKQESGNIYITNSDGKETYIPEIMVVNIISFDDSKVVDGEYWFPNLHDSRYFFSPTAFGLERGEGYYSTSYFMLWQAQMGLTDNFSIGAGTTPLGVPIMLNFKITGNIAEKSNMAYGWLFVGDRSDGDILQLNMPFAVYTRGTKENNFTIGTGLAFNKDYDLDSEHIVINIAATQRLAKRFSFVFETWVFNAFSENDVSLLGGPGIRYFRKINRVTARNGAGASTWDLQFLTFPELWDADSGMLFIPMAGRSWKF